MVKLAGPADKEVENWQESKRLGFCDRELWEIEWHDIRFNLRYAPRNLYPSEMDRFAYMVERRLLKLKPTTTQEDGQ